VHYLAHTLRLTLTNNSNPEWQPIGIADQHYQKQIACQVVAFTGGTLTVPRIMSATLSAIMMVAMLVSADTISGITDASTTLRPSTPITLQPAHNHVTFNSLQVPLQDVTFCCWFCLCVISKVPIAEKIWHNRLNFDN